MSKQQEQKNGFCICSVGNLQKLKKQAAQSEEDREKYFDTLKYCNSKLVQDEEV